MSGALLHDPRWPRHSTLNSPNPALVTHRAAQRLPRLALFLFCAAYVIPGLFGRDPWKNADITAFGYMVNMAEGRTSWFSPAIAGLPSDGAPSGVTLSNFPSGVVRLCAFDPVPFSPTPMYSCPSVPK